MKTDKSIPLLIIGILFALLAVIFGALGAHYLSDKIDAGQLSSYKTAVQYQFYHAFALIIVYLLYRHYHKRIVILAGHCFIAGTILFSGSIYGFTIAHLQDTSWSWLGPITPLGGLFLIVGWVMLLIGVGWKSVEMSRKS